jgi:hypothetical protein
MRLFFGMLLAGGLVLGQASFARAQNSLNAFGTYPAGITTGSPAPYGLDSSGFYGMNYGYPFTYSTQPFSYYGSNYLAPNAMLYNRGYGGYLNPSTGYYSRGYSAYSVPGSYDVYSYPTYGSSYPSPGNYRNSGMFSRDRWRGW